MLCKHRMFFFKTIFNLIIRGFLKKKQPKMALKTFDFALQIAGEHPDVPLYTTMIDYYVQVILPKQFSWDSENKIFFLHSETKNVNGAFDMVREMEQRGFKPNLWTYNQLLRAAANGDPEVHIFYRPFLESFNHELNTSYFFSGVRMVHIKKCMKFSMKF